MRYYKGSSPCPGCGLSGELKPRRSKDCLCHSCSSLLRLGNEISKLRSQQTDKIVNVRLWISGLSYVSTGESDNLSAAIREFLGSISQQDKMGNCPDRVIGSYTSSQSHTVRDIKITPDSADKLESLIKALYQYSDAVHAKGVKHGSNLLAQLGSGDLSPDAFVKRVNER